MANSYLDEDPIFKVGLGELSGRYLLYFFNMLFFGFAAIMFSVCLFVHFDPNVMGDFLGNVNFTQYYNACTVCAVGACIVMTGSLIACLGTYYWNLTLLFTYAIFTVVGFIVNLGGAIFLLCVGLSSTYAYPYIQGAFQELLWQYNYNMLSKYSVDVIQEELGCCGAVTPRDYNKLHMPVPDTCRDHVTGNQYKNSCALEMSRYLELWTGIISGIALWICFLQIFTIVFVICMYRGFMKRRKQMEEELSR